jgi:cytoskeleton protein RodZ
MGVGAALREERLRQKLSLGEIALETRISQRYLEAIENEDFDRLPAPVFTRSFVRQYAAHLNVDPAPMLANLPPVDLDGAPMPDPQPKPRRSFRVGVAGGGIRWSSGFASLTWLLVAFGGAMFAYIHFNRPVSAKPNPVESTSRIANAPVRSAPPAAAPEMAAAPEPPPPSEPSVAPPAERPIQILLTARERSWVQVIADGKPAFVGTLNPRDSRSIGADELVRLVTGNAGGIEISLNGKPLEPIGPSGQIRTVRLTAEGLQFVRKTPPPPPDPL